METDSPGHYITLVVQMQQAADGTWYLSVAGTYPVTALPLVPGILVVRLWQPSGTNLLRGSIRLNGSDQWAPIQSNTQLEALVRAWLFSGDTAPGS